MEIRRREWLAGAAGLACATTWSSPLMAEQQDPGIPAGAVVLVAQLKAKTGEEEAVKDALMTMVTATRKEPGCICYNLHRSTDDPALFAFYEVWKDKEAFDIHGKSEHMAAMRKAIAGKMERGGGGVTFYEYLQ